ncbi:MAG: glycosyltransferase [Clostridia bacterium]|nr:glycosyltransferase [Clostridia bacterium]
MKVLWIVNMVFPDIAKKLGFNTSIGGGWLLDLAKGVSEHPDVELAVMTYYAGKEFIDMEVEGTRYFLFPGGGKRLLHDNPKTGDDCKKAVVLFKPDLIHLHGTEYAPGYKMLEVHPEIPTLLTIQGILKRISQEYFGGFSTWEIIKMTDKKDLLKLKSPIAYKMLYNKNAKREEKFIKKVKYVTGRTDWDKSTMLAMNPDLKYYRCNYNLRNAFYESEKWSVDTMTRHTIYTGSCHTALKGVHNLIRALALVKNRYPDVKLYIPGGRCAVKNGRLVSPQSFTKYIEKLITELGLDENVEFVGDLGPEAVAEQLRRANVCVVTSAVEGASATLCEAMMVGTPSICSYRGGMTDLLTDKVSGFTYDYPEYPQIALRIMEIFENDELAQTFSKRTIELANERHKRDRNPNDMVNVYKEVLENERKKTV